MKKLFIPMVFLSMLVLFSTEIFAQPASITWPLTSTGNANAPSGNIQGLAQIIGGGPAPAMSVFSPYVTNGQRLWRGNTGWPASSLENTRYIQFNASPATGNIFSVTNVAFNYGDFTNSSNSNVLYFQAYYSTDNWSTSTVLNTTPLAYLNTTMSAFSQNINVSVLSGQSFSLRIYPYAPSGSVAGMPAFAIHNNVVISGSTISAYGSICGMKFNDLNGNGVLDPGEPGLPNWEIGIKNDNAPNSTSIFTDANGNYCFNNLPPGTYNIRENHQSGWQQTMPDSFYTIPLSSGQNVTDINFGNWQPPQMGAICGIKFNDLNGDGVMDSGEPPIPGWIIHLTYQQPGGTTTLTDTTDNDGAFCFYNLDAGSYTVSEVNQSGWQQTTPSSPGTYIINLTQGEINFNSIFGNKQASVTGSICGMKFNDLNGNGIMDGGENGLQDWIINMTFQNAAGTITLSDTTDANGNYCFNNLYPGSYTLSEVNQSGWLQTLPSSPGTYSVVLSQGENADNINFGNQEIILGSICGVKYNDLDGDGVKDPGEPVLAGWEINLTYQNAAGTIHLTDTTGIDGSYCFTDLQPGGTLYHVFETNQPGWQQTSSPPTYNVYLANNHQIDYFNFGNQYIGEIDSCTADTLVLSTGWDYNNNTTYTATNPATDQDVFWTLVNAPTNNGAVNLNGPAWVIVNNSAWDPALTGSQWISAFQTAGSNEANISASLDPYVFRKSICVSDTSDLMFNINVLVDNRVVVNFVDANGTVISQIGALNTSSTSNFTSPNNMQQTVTGVLPGQYFIQIELRNDNSGSPMGVNLQGIVTGAHASFINPLCCNPAGSSITGFKFNDVNNNGVLDTGENVLPGWEFTLSGSGASQTSTTDANGNFLFTGLNPGTYTITETMQSGWIAGITGSQQVVTIGENEAINNIIFGNIASTDNCPTDTLILSTGWNHNNNSTYTATNPATDQDVFWTLVNAPTNNGTVNLNGPAWVIQNNTAWDPALPGSQWISAFQTPGSNQANTNPSIAPYVFQKSICVNDTSDLIFNIDVLVDNRVVVNFVDANGTLISQIGALNTSSTSNFTSPNNMQQTVTGVLPGQYFIQIELRNDNPNSPMGVNLQGTVIGAHSSFIDPLCCSLAGSSITGFKFNDVNNNGVLDTGENVLPGWEFTLSGSGASQTSTTDANGNFLFTGLNPGTYTITETMQSGWIAGVTGSQQVVTIGENEAINSIIFGNLVSTVTGDSCQFLCNTDFEDDQLVAVGSQGFFDQDSVSCWNTTASDSIIEVWGSGFNGVPAYSGNQFIELNAFMVGTLFQNFNSGAGGPVSISFAHRGRAGFLDSMSVSITPASGSPVILGTFVGNDNFWTLNTVNYTLLPNTNYVLSFISLPVNGTSAGGNFLDSITVACPSDSVGGICSTLDAVAVRTSPGDCCWTLSLNQPSDLTGIASIKIEALAPNVFTTGTGLGSGYQDWFVSGSTTFIPPTGEVPGGNLNNFFNMCLNYVTSPQYVVVSWLDGLDNVVCSDTVELDCEIACTTVLTDTVTCAGNGIYNYSYTFTNNADYSISEIIYTVQSPGIVTISPDSVILNPVVASGANSGLQTIQVSGAVPGDMVVILAKYESPDGCCWCYETISFIVPSCATVCDSLNVTASGSPDACCYSISVNNNSSMTFSNIEFALLSGGMFSTISTTSAPGWAFTNVSPNNVIKLVKLPILGGIGNGSFNNVLDMCIRQYPNAMQVVEVRWIKNGTVICRDTLRFECTATEIEIDTCSQVINGTLKCLEDGTFLYKFRVQNNSDIVSTGFGIFPTTPGVTFSNTIFQNVSILPGQVSPLDSIIISGIEPGQNVCFQTSIFTTAVPGENIFNYCCHSDTVCITMPECDGKVGCVTPPRGMVGWWPLDELPGATIAADIMNSNNGTTHPGAIGPLSPGSGPAPGFTSKVDGALYFYGQPVQYIEVQDNASLNFGAGDFSIDAWVYPISAPKDVPSVIVNKTDASTSCIGYSLYIQESKVVFGVYDGTNNAVINAPVTNNQWQHITATRSGGGISNTLTIYINGVSVTSTITSGGIGSVSNSGPLFIGAVDPTYIACGISVPKGYGEIIIDELEIFSRVLNRQEILSIFNADSSGKCKNFDPTDIGEAEAIPTEYRLWQSYPNPFNPAAIIPFDIPNTGFVRLSVYDILGREIRILVDEEKKPGHYEVTFDAHNLSSGTYFYVLRTNNFVESKKMILLK